MKFLKCTKKLKRYTTCQMKYRKSLKKYFNKNYDIYYSYDATIIDIRLNRGIT